jgi:hypothetical protein
MKHLPQILWIFLLVACGAIIGPNILGWALIGLMGFLIFPRFWEAREDAGKRAFTGARTIVTVLFTIAVAFTAWGRIGEPMPFVGSEAKAAVAASLRDPSSAEFRNIMVGTSATCGEVNGKNGFGAYAGFKPFVYVDGVVRIEPEQPIVADVESQTAYYQQVAGFARASRQCYE